MNNTTKNPNLYYKINLFMMESTYFKAAFFLSCERLTVFRTHSQTLFVVLKKGNKVMSRLIQCIRQLISSIM